MNLKNKIFSKIHKEKIEPIPESYFTNKYRILWGFLGVSILLGIFGTAFLIEDSSEFMSMIHYTRGDAGLFLLPNIFWVILIMFLIFVGIKSLRNTSVGYRYPYSKIVLSIFIIVSCGILFRLSGFGPKVHTFLVANVPGIATLLYNETAWNNPENGRLAGTITQKTDTMIELKSVDGSTWNIDITNAFISPKVVGTIGEQIRILGEKTGVSSFQGERIMPWFGQGMGNGGGYGKGSGMMR